MTNSHAAAGYRAKVSVDNQQTVNRLIGNQKIINRLTDDQSGKNRNGKQKVIKGPSNIE